MSTIRTAEGAPVLYGWRRTGARYTKTVDGVAYVILRNVSPEANGYGPAGTVSWQVTVDDEWAGTDPFTTKSEAVDFVSNMVGKQ